LYKKHVIRKNHERAIIACAFIVAVALHMVVLVFVPTSGHHGVEEKTKKTINVEFHVHNEVITTNIQVHQESTPESKQNSTIISVSRTSRRSNPTRLHDIKSESIVENEETFAPVQIAKESKELDLSVPNFSSIHSASPSKNSQIPSAIIAKNERDIYKTDIPLLSETPLGRSIAAATIPDCMKQQRSGGLLAIPGLIADAATGRCK